MEGPEIPAAVVEEDAGRQVLVLRGSLGTAEVRQLWEVALQIAKTGRDVVVDGEQLRHLGGAALQVLLALKLDLGRRGALLSIRGSAPSLTAAATLAGLADDLDPRAPPVTARISS
jgi:anti-anti-sigma regulatory factor